MIPLYLMASYAYYIENDPFLSDCFYDKMVSNELKSKWFFLEHPHKHLIDDDDLSAGTGYALPKEKYPKRIVQSLKQLRKDAENGDLGYDIEL